MKYQKITTSAPIRLCFIGCGKVTIDHIKAAKKCPENIQFSFASRTLSKAEEYLKKFGGVHAYGSYEEAIEDKQQDVIMINTPPHVHFELSQKALLHDKHVIVEKPPFFQSADFDVLGELAEQKRLQLMVAENYYYKPLRAALETILKEKLIGDPLFLMINATKTQASKGDWREDKTLTGYGALFEGGIHWINFINNLGLNITSITGFLPKQKTDLERSIQVVANTSEGTIINLLYSWEVDTIFKGLRLSKIYGRKGSISFETNGIFVFVRGKKKRLLFPNLPHITGRQKMFDDFMNALRNGIAPKFNWQQAKQDLVLIEQIYQDLKAK